MTDREVMSRQVVKILLSVQELQRRSVFVNISPDIVVVSSFLLFFSFSVETLIKFARSCQVSCIAKRSSSFSFLRFILSLIFAFKALLHENEENKTSRKSNDI